ncbi:hypothetical protein COL27_29890, partial [Bacillus sp. AFS075960]
AARRTGLRKHSVLSLAADFPPSFVREKALGAWRMQRVPPSASGPSMIGEGLRARISDAAERLEERIGSVRVCRAGLPVSGSVND